MNCLQINARLGFIFYFDQSVGRSVGSMRSTGWFDLHFDGGYGQPVNDKPCCVEPDNNDGMWH